MIAAALGWITGGSSARTVVTLLAGVSLGSWAGWHVQDWRHGRLRAQAIEQQARDTLRQIERRDAASTTYQTEQAHADKTHTQIRERVRVINAQPAAAGQCLGADGLRELGAAIDNGAPTAAGPGRAIPAAGQAD